MPAIVAGGLEGALLEPTGRGHCRLQNCLLLRVLCLQPGFLGNTEQATLLQGTEETDDGSGEGVQDGGALTVRSFTP